MCYILYQSLWFDTKSLKMKIAFTICSNNYIAQASVLAESFKKFHEDYYFAIILVDKLSDAVNYSSIKADKILPVEEISGYNLEEIFDKYDIVELNTAVKPFVFQYFIREFKDVNVLYYFDPDLKFFASIKFITQQLQTASIVLTPHITSPIPRDYSTPTDQDFLNYGLYNLGFLGLNPRHKDVPALLDWWGDRTFHLGYDRVAKGLFVDQLWMNLTTLFYKDVVVSFDKGLNMGPWNLHERRIKSIDANQIFLDNGDTLKFYHFSSYRFNNPALLAKNYNRYSFEDVGELKKLYADYLVDLTRHHMEEYYHIQCAYIRPPVPETNAVKVKRRIRNAFKRIADTVLDISEKTPAK